MDTCMSFRYRIAFFSLSFLLTIRCFLGYLYQVHTCVELVVVEIDRFRGYGARNPRERGGCSERRANANLAQGCDRPCYEVTHHLV